MNKYGFLANLLLAMMLMCLIAIPIYGISAEQTFSLRVEGMTWTACEGAVESALEDIPGVISVNADYLTGTASVAYNSEQTTPESILAEFNSQGIYSASVKSTVDGEPPMQMAEREDGAAEFMASGQMSRNMMCRSPMSGFWWRSWW